MSYTSSAKRTNENRCSTMTTVPQNKGKWSKKWQHCSCVWCVRSKDFLFRKVYWGSQIFLLLTYGIKGTVKYTFLETDTIEMILIFLESFVVDMIQKTVKPVPTQPVWRREEEAEVEWRWSTYVKMVLEAPNRSFWKWLIQFTCLAKNIQPKHKSAMSSCHSSSSRYDMVWKLSKPWELKAKISLLQAGRCSRG